MLASLYLFVYKNSPIDTPKTPPTYATWTLDRPGKCFLEGVWTQSVIKLLPTSWLLPCVVDTVWLTLQSQVVSVPVSTARWSQSLSLQRGGLSPCPLTLFSSVL